MDESIRGSRRSYDSTLRMAMREWLRSGQENFPIHPMSQMARLGTPLTGFIPWKQIKQWIHNGALQQHFGPDALSTTFRNSFTFEQVCELVRHGYLRMDQFTTQEIIHLLEQSIRAEGQTPLVETLSGTGDDQLRRLERRYHQDPTKHNLLSYAYGCLRRSLPPTVDFCLVCPEVDPFFDAARDLPASRYY